ncbi:MAG: AAA family ATPase, partial [Flavobacteriales bacterium]|nr:AAA family ATPase [Flavobacteriales bacterium]
MIRNLLIKNFALIEKLIVDFTDGFIVLSGETGAGKSIILDAISLLSGKRS